MFQGIPLEVKKYLILLLVLFGPVVHAESVETWLNKMNGALHGLNYTGTYVYINDNRIDTMQIVHVVDEQGEHERLLSLNGEAREILRDSDKVTCILPADKSVIVGKHKAGTGLPALVPDDVLKLGSLYDAELIGRDRIAGYPAVIIAIEPRDKMRYGYRIWLEEDSGMVLRSDIMDTNAKVIEQMMFTDISLQSPVSEEMLKPTVAHEGFKVITDQMDSPQQPGIEPSAWTFEKMPKGFRITSQSIKSMPMKKHPVEHFVLSDGLASVSVYIEQSASDDGQTLEGESNMGSVNAYGRQIADHRITVMGEVPRATVKQIAESVAKN
jgi:sigma-E factor negative regulatory protein RseB